MAITVCFFSLNFTIINSRMYGYRPGNSSFDVFYGFIVILSLRLHPDFFCKNVLLSSIFFCFGWWDYNHLHFDWSHKNVTTFFFSFLYPWDRKFHRQLHSRLTAQQCKCFYFVTDRRQNSSCIFCASFFFETYSRNYVGLNVFKTSKTLTAYIEIKRIFSSGPSNNHTQCVKADMSPLHTIRKLAVFVENNTSRRTYLKWDRLIRQKFW